MWHLTEVLIENSGAKFFVCLFFFAQVQLIFFRPKICERVHQRAINAVLLMSEIQIKKITQPTPGKDLDHNL